jgi:hypothetical protein
MRDALSKIATGAIWTVRGILGLLCAGLGRVSDDEDRRLHDADMIGEYNHRTGRLDAGADPYGWYDED